MARHEKRRHGDIPNRRHCRDRAVEEKPEVDASVLWNFDKKGLIDHRGIEDKAKQTEEEEAVLGVIKRPCVIGAVYR